jgi:hypothetical protein
MHIDKDLQIPRRDGGGPFVMVKEGRSLALTF